MIVNLAAATGPACARAAATIELRADDFAQGVNVAGDVDLLASTRIYGSGLYCAGCLRGRQWLVFAADGADPLGRAPDWVRGQRWPAAGVHATGSIWAEGTEIHGPGSAPGRYPSDSDVDNDGAIPVAVPSGPDSGALATLRDNALEPGAALADGVLDVGRLPPLRPDVAAGPGLSEGYAVVVAPPADGGPLRVVGERPVGSCPVTLVLTGDAQVGEPDRSVRMCGAIVACGALDIEGPVCLHGHLFARGLAVNAPLEVDVSQDWRNQPLAGVTQPVIVSLTRS